MLCVVLEPQARRCAARAWLALAGQSGGSQEKLLKLSCQQYDVIVHLILYDIIDISLYISYDIIVHDIM